MQQGDILHIFIKIKVWPIKRDLFPNNISINMKTPLTFQKILIYIWTWNNCVHSKIDTAMNFILCNTDILFTFFVKIKLFKKSSNKNILHHSWTFVYYNYYNIIICADLFFHQHNVHRFLFSKICVFFIF